MRNENRRKKKRENEERKPTKLRRGSRVLAVMSALANGVLAISADVQEITRRYPSISHLEWRRMRGLNVQATHVDFEAVLEDAKERSAYRRALRTILDRRYAKLTKQKGRWVLEVTELGQKRIREIELESLAIARPSIWDKTWRIVLYDIPDDRRVQRDIFRDRLKRLSFLKLQRSVFVFPYACEDELDAIIQYLGISDYVTFFKTDSLGYQEAKALKYFKLTR